MSFIPQEKFMRRAIELAKLGGGHVHPNPLVGAVIVRDGQILAEGYHHKCGDLHAERDCLMNASESNVDVSGAEMYVTLEPCCHTAFALPLCAQGQDSLGWSVRQRCLFPCDAPRFGRRASRGFFSFERHVN